MYASICLALLALAPAPPSTAAAPTLEGEFRELAYTDALGAAREEKKVVMIDFFTTWCGPCKRLERETWPEESVRAWLRENTIALKVDAERDVPLARRYGIRSYPTIQFLSPDGLPIGEISGFFPPKEFLRQARSLLENADPLARAERLADGFQTIPLRRLNLAKACAVRGKHEEALSHYLWCWDNALDQDYGFAAVRATYLVTDIRTLGETYPAATQALQGRAQKIADHIVAGNLVDSFVSDCIAVHVGLGDPRPLLALSDRLRGEDVLRAEQRKRLAPHVLEPLVEARRYADVFEFDVAPQEELAKAIQRYENRRGKLMRGADASEPPAVAKSRARAMLMGELYAEAALGAEQRDVADALIERLIAFDASAGTYERLISRAARVPDADAVRAIVARADASALSDADKARVRRAAQ